MIDNKKLKKIMTNLAKGKITQEEVDKILNEKEGIKVYGKSPIKVLSDKTKLNKTGGKTKSHKHT